MTDEPQHGHHDDDLWSWIDQEDVSADVPDIDPDEVLAVMVVHDAHEWLPRQLLSLARLTPRPGRIVAVDTGSTDGSVELLRAAHAEGVLHDLLTVGPEVTFGAAVHLAVGDSEPAWLWLLHDDSAPHRDALGHLLHGAKQSDIVVPKLLEPKRRNYPETLSEVGQAITPGGMRVPLVEVGDIDQQQSESRDVLGASTAGLLIRGETWRETGGLAPEVERHRDGVDLCWRANAVGFRVLTWPAAALNHLRAGHTGMRPDPDHPHVSDRLAALRVAGSRGASGIGLAAASLLRSVGFLLAKSPSYAAAELRALRTYRATPETTAALAARLPAEDLTPEDLLPNRFWPLRNAVDKLGAGVAERYRDLTDASSGTSIDELTGDDFAGSHVRQRVFSPVTALVVVLLLVAAVAARTLLGGGPVSGGGLLPPPSTFAAAWQAYLTGQAPWLGIAAVSSLAGLGSPGWFAFLAIVVTPLLAALSALALLRRVGVGTKVAVVSALAWAAATVLLGLVTAGDVSGMVLAVVGPLLARAVHSVVVNETSGAERLRAPAGVAFWLVVVAVVWPAALVALTIAGVVWAVRERSRRAEVAVAVLPAWAFVAPWLPTLVRHPGRLLTGVDPLAWPDYPPASYAMVLGRILPSGLPLWANVVFFGALGLVAVVGIARLPLRGRVWALSGLAAALLIGTLLSRLTVAVDGGTARPLLSPWALLVVAALLAPFVLAERQRDRFRTPAVVALALSALIAVGAWGWVGFAGPVGSTTSVLPGYVRDVVASTRDSRALLIERREGTVTWNVVDARQPRWGSGERNAVGSYDEQFASLAHAVAAGAPPGDLAAWLTRMGVSHLWLGGFGPEHKAALDNLQGMVGAAADERSTVWTVSGLVSRAVLQDGDESTPLVDGTLPPGGADRRIVLAEEPGSDWRATVAGRGLDRVDVTDADLGSVAFESPPTDGGRLVIEPTPHWWRFALHLAVLLAIGVLAAPTLGGAASTARRGHA